jgi:hypothetical protein
VAAVFVVSARDHQATAGNGELHVHTVVIALLMMVVWELDRHMAVADSWMKALQALGMLVDEGLNGRGGVDPAVGDSNRYCHTQEVGTESAAATRLRSCS